MSKAVSWCSSIVVALILLSGSPNAKSNEKVEKSADHCNEIDNVVINEVSKILGVKVEELKVSLPIADQKIAGDELDVVEIVMSIEEALGIEMSDDKIDAKAGNPSLSMLPRRLTIKMLQEIAKDSCKSA
jgi:acyl carrier protein